MDPCDGWGCVIFETMSNEQVIVLVGVFRRVRYRGSLCSGNQGSAQRRLHRIRVPLKNVKLSDLLKYTAGGAHHRLLSSNTHILQRLFLSSFPPYLSDFLTS